MSSSSSSLYCFVPECRNTKKSTPEKLFFNVPTGKIRDKWCSIVRRNKVALTSHLWCCEDHFLLEEDVENWTRYSILKDAGKENFRLRLKKGVTPHIFDCQQDKHKSHTNEPRSAFMKRQTLGVLKTVNWNSDATQCIAVEIPSASVLETQVAHLDKDNTVTACPNHLSAVSEPLLVWTMETQTQAEDLEEDIVSSCEIVDADPPATDAAVSPCSLEFSRQSSGSSSSFNNTSLVDSACQVSLKPHFRSKGIQTAPKTADKRIQTIAACSCFRQPCRSEEFGDFDGAAEEEVEGTETELNVSSGTLFTLNSSVLDAGCYDEGTSTDDEGALEHRKSLCLDSTMFLIEDDPRAFLGIDPINMCVISTIEHFGNLSKTEIFIAIRKLRLRETNNLLAKYFNLSPSSISRIINKAFPVMAALLKSLIIWPDRECIQANVPSAFMANYSKVESIIDCFEIQIEKPTDAEKQAATWSSYKDCNTVKFLVSMTPDGLINFVSRGFTGRVSDIALIRKSGFLDVLKEGTCVMADRGFKEIESELVQKNCKLVRPPSVKKNCKLTVQDAQLTKSIASLRIHIERAIRRIREYKFLEPHATIHHMLLDIVNHAVIVAAALVNLQGPLIL